VVNTNEKYTPWSKDTNYSLNMPEKVNEILKNPETFLIESSSTCNQTAEPSKTLKVCLHNGLCSSRYLILNTTHLEQVVICVCLKVRLKSFFDSFFFPLIFFLI
jgi:hypothetical protein